jgi:NTE family protein
MEPDEPFTLVLGAGGRAGLAYHAGSLLALHLHGLDPRRAVRVTGTSAGSVVAALLVAGATAEDICALAVEAPPRPEFEAVDSSVRAALALRPRLSPSALASLADPRRVVAAAIALGRRNPRAAMIAALPGLVDLRPRFSFLDDLAAADAVSEPVEPDESDPASQPDAPSWRVVAARPDGRRRVFAGSRRQPVPAVAVAASCAVPGVYAAVEHDGERLVDGGIHSTTNADLAQDDESDTVVVIAPMTGVPARRTLQREIEILRGAGKRVLVVRPSPATRAVMGRNLLSGARTRQIVRAAFLEAVTHLDGPHCTDLSPIEATRHSRDGAGVGVS